MPQPIRLPAALTPSTGGIGVGMWRQLTVSAIGIHAGELSVEYFSPRTWSRVWTPRPRIQITG